MPAKLLPRLSPERSSAFDGFAALFLPSAAGSAARARFERIASLRGACSGAAVLKDEAQDNFVFVASGTVKLVAHASGGREQVLAFHFAGDLVAVPAHGAHSYTLLALSSCEALVFAGAGFVQLCSAYPAASRALLAAVLRSLNRSREKTISLGRKTAQERLAGFLIGLAERIGHATENACLLQLPMSRRDIADSLGLTIETVSRQLGELREAGLVETSGRSEVRLLDLEALAARAGHLPANRPNLSQINAALPSAT